MEQPTFALIPSGIASGEVFSVLPDSGVGDFTFSRNLHTATRINKDGLIESVASDMPRLNYEINNGVVDSCPHLILEMSSTNRVTYSEDFTQWGNIQTTDASNDTVSPTGKKTADKITKLGNNSNDRVRLPSIGVTNSKPYAISFFVKNDNNVTGAVTTLAFRVTSGTLFRQGIEWTGNVPALTESNSNGTRTNKILQNYGNGWYRVGFAFTTDGTDGVFEIDIDRQNGTNTTSIFVWGAQLEEDTVGSSKDSYVTSYIPTSNGASTRSSESCTGAGDVNTFNSVEGVLYAELKRDVDEDNGFRRIVIDNGNSNLQNTVRLGYSSTTDEIKAVVKVGNVEQCALVFAGLSVKQFRKMALLYKPNRYELWVDGVRRQEQLTTSITFPIGTLNNLSFEQASGADKLRAKVKDVRYYDTDGMTPEEITNLLTQLTQ